MRLDSIPRWASRPQSSLVSDLMLYNLDTSFGPALTDIVLLEVSVTPIAFCICVGLTKKLT